MTRRDPVKEAIQRNQTALSEIPGLPSRTNADGSVKRDPYIEGLEARNKTDRASLADVDSSLRMANAIVRNSVKKAGEVSFEKLCWALGYLTYQGFLVVKYAKEVAFQIVELAPEGQYKGVKFTSEEIISLAERKVEEAFTHVTNQGTKTERKPKVKPRRRVLDVIEDDDDL